jgi:CheY-like chemotaxis protein
MNRIRMSETKCRTTPEDLSSLDLLSPVRILCADDQPDFRATISKSLLRAGYEVISVADGEQAWEALQSAPYDLLITDQQMPRLTGAELIVRMRLNGLGMSAMVLSSDLRLFSASRCESLRIAAVLPKPCSLAELLGTVQEVLRLGSRGPSPDTGSKFPQLFPKQKPTEPYLETEEPRENETNS